MGGKLKARVPNELAQNLLRIEHEISTSLQSSGRSREDVLLLAVSKTKESAEIRSLYQAGQKSFAENYQQEAQNKQKTLADLSIDWHFIGKLQSNKINHIVGQYSLLHAVDRLEIAEKINNRAQQLGHIQPILIEVNIADEASKHGIGASDLESFVRSLLPLSHLQIDGLMVMPPLFEEPERTRPFFRKARKLMQEVSATVIQSPQQKTAFRHLSMGTSSDYKIALQEGATIIRLGTVLFGPRMAKGSLA